LRDGGEVVEMGNFVEAGKTGELNEGAMKEVLLQKHSILLARVDNRYYAADNLCPHMEGKLSKGTLEGTVITCPIHGSKFGLKDGQVIRWLRGTGAVSALGKLLKPPKRLKIYNVKIEGDSILIEI